MNFIEEINKETHRTIEKGFEIEIIDRVKPHLEYGFVVRVEMGDTFKANLHYISKDYSMEYTYTPETKVIAKELLVLVNK